MFNKKIWRLAHKEEMKAYNKKYRATHRKQHADSSRKWALAHPEYVKKLIKKYEQSLKGKEMRRKTNARRKHLGFLPLNEYFVGSESHHIDKEFIIYIPEKLHRSIKHNLITGINMKKINTEAFKFLKKQGKI